VATGVWPVDKVRDRNADFHPAGRGMGEGHGRRFDPACAHRGHRRRQRILRYDFLVVATGVHLDYAQIEGMDVAAIGSNGLASVYPARRRRRPPGRPCRPFRAKGGEALMTLPATPLKCAGAPLKMTFMLRDRLRQAGTLGGSEGAASSRRWATCSASRRSTTTCWQRWKDAGHRVEYHAQAHRRRHRRAPRHLRHARGRAQERPYDFLHVVPPMRAPDAVKNSDAGLEGRSVRRRRLAGGRQGHAAAPPLPQRVRHRRHQRHAARQDRGHGEEERAAGGAQPGAR
jgi:sulfide:quinone oxidoreductase